MANYTPIYRTLSFAGSITAFIKGNAQNPVEIIFNYPVNCSKDHDEKVIVD
jgi:hypothetical protein